MPFRSRIFSSVNSCRLLEIHQLTRTSTFLECWRQFQSSDYEIRHQLRADFSLVQFNPIFQWFCSVDCERSKIAAVESSDQPIDRLTRSSCVDPRGQIAIWDWQVASHHPSRGAKIPLGQKPRPPFPLTVQSPPPLRGQPLWSDVLFIRGL